MVYETPINSVQDLFSSICWGSPDTPNVFVIVPSSMRRRCEGLHYNRSLELLSIIGGYIGMYLGISMASASWLFEIPLSLAAWFLKKRRKREKKMGKKKLNRDKRRSQISRFVEWAQNEIAVVPDFHKRTLFSDEAHFWLNGYVNKQNCRIWSEANPQVHVETPLYPEKLTVWCALWAGGILLQKR
ncbi:hypothetical protein TNCV_2844281 [Trichonephila clavipes]|nr:hypothetical protein TNCV_2844281 [Trichonephila clavipes]